MESLEKLQEIMESDSNLISKDDNFNADFKKGYKSAIDDMIITIKNIQKAIKAVN